MTVCSCIPCPTWQRAIFFAITFMAMHGSPMMRADENASKAVFQADIVPLLSRFCMDCHSGKDAQAEIDLGRYQSAEDIARAPDVWIKVRDMLDSQQMPPRDAKIPNDAERSLLQQWVRSRLRELANANAGDPGPVVLRRLNNAEYTYTLRQLCGITSLDPAKEFPVDGAAGEGFTNVGNAQAMSPAMVSKYLEAAKQVAEHIVLTPSSFRFSSSTTRRDWTEECLTNIRNFYRKYSSSAGATNVNLQGIKFDTNQGGRLPLEAYLAATMQAKELGEINDSALKQLARKNELSGKYLSRLVREFSATADKPSAIMSRLRDLWNNSSPSNMKRLSDEITQWQNALWKFNVIGHVVRDAAGERSSQRWMEPVSPFADSIELRHKLVASPSSNDFVLYLSAGDCSDGNLDDWVVWQNPRLVAAGQPDLPLADIASVMQSLPQHRRRIALTAADCLARIAKLEQSPSTHPATDGLTDTDILIQKGWLSLLGYADVGPSIDRYLPTKSDKVAGYDFIQGWTGAEALSVLTNASNDHVRIPGNMLPHSVAVHPSPKLRVNIGWRSPVTGSINMMGLVQSAHPECGNGIHWTLELRRGTMTQTFVNGFAQGNNVVNIPETRLPTCRVGDLIVLSVGPRDGNHSCDLTRVDLTLEAMGQTWNLSKEVADNILAGNPQADSKGNKDVWHFFSEPDRTNSKSTIPMGSLLAQWIGADSDAMKRQLADKIQRLLVDGPQELDKNSPDHQLYERLMSLTSPLVMALRAHPSHGEPAADSKYGMDRNRFGKHPNGASVSATDLCVQAPSVLEIHLPPDVAGYEFVTRGLIHSEHTQRGSVQLQLTTSKPNQLELVPNLPIVVSESSQTRKQFEAAMDDFRWLFPASLCYEKIVPVDEVVTLTLFFREDEHLQRLMLDDGEILELQRLWDELLYVSQEPYLLVAAFEQIAEYATQDRPDKVTEFSPLRKPILDRADRFRERLIADEPSQLNALVQFANKAYRHDLNAGEERQLRNLYATLRKEGLSHSEAFQLTFARILVSPQFLYRTEKSHPIESHHPVSNWELASRLSYFLWSCGPDEELLRLARSGDIQKDAVLKQQLVRMLKHENVRNMAIEFGAQWLNIHDFREHDQKSETVFPTFESMKNEMYEETIQFFTDLIRNDGSVLDILMADYSFLNQSLASHYAIPGIEGSHWRKVERLRDYHRGGILSMASILSSQSGASRTSPILRGNWISEVLLGERLPRPPKNVPTLPETPPGELTERELIAKHSSDPACAKCHAKIDPLGFALENFDAIGRYRTKDSNGLHIDTLSTLNDGTVVRGMEEIREYLAGKRRNDFLKQFCRKLLGYGLGRSVQLSDEPLLEQMIHMAQKRENRIHSLIEIIVFSKQFREVRGQLYTSQQEEVDR